MDTDRVRSIAREAYIHRYPLVDNYRFLHARSIDTANPAYGAPFNRFAHNADVAKAGQAAVQTANADTPCSRATLDLRAEPVVLTTPGLEPGRTSCRSSRSTPTRSTVELAEHVGPGIVDAKEQRIRTGVVNDPVALVAALRETFIPKGEDDLVEPPGPGPAGCDPDLDVERRPRSRERAERPRRPDRVLRPDRSSGGDRGAAIDVRPAIGEAELRNAPRRAAALDGDRHDLLQRPEGEADPRRCAPIGRPDRRGEPIDRVAGGVGAFRLVDGDRRRRSDSTSSPTPSP